jgi:oligogalacturonide lyase
MGASGPACRDEWIDPDTGHRIVRLSRIPGESQSFYFHQNAFTAEGDKMVFTHTDTNRVRQLCVLDWKTRAITPLTDSFASCGEIVHAKTRQAFWQRSGTLCVTHLDSLSTRAIAQLPIGWQVSTVNAAATLLAVSFVEGGLPVAPRGAKSSFDQVFEAKRPQQLFTVETATGKTNLIHGYEGWLGHIQFSPTDPTLLQFCHEGPWHLLDRIWHIRTDGSGLRLLHKRTMPMEIAGQARKQPLPAQLRRCNRSTSRTWLR